MKKSSVLIALSSFFAGLILAAFIFVYMPSSEESAQTASADPVASELSTNLYAAEVPAPQVRRADLNFSEIAARISPAVVYIEAQKVERVQTRGFFDDLPLDDFWRRFFNDPEDRETFKRERERSLEAGGMEGENEYRYVSPDGSIRWMHDKWTVIRNQNGQPLAIEGFIRDNTRRKQAEDELERIRRNALIGSYIVQDGRFVYVNPEFCRIMQYSAEELIGTVSLQYVHEDYVARVKEYTRAMLKEERFTPYEFCIVDRNGNVKWVMETVTSIYHEGRRAILGHFMDITQARRAAEERQEREKLQTILEMAGAVGHELNNPLQVVLVCSEKIDPDSLLDKPSRKRLLLLKKNIKRIIQIITKFQNITQYAVKDYIQGTKIIDIDAASREKDPS